MFKAETFYVDVGTPNTASSWIKIVHRANASAMAWKESLLFEQPQAQYLDEDGSEVEDYPEVSVIHPARNLPYCSVRILAKTERARKHLSVARNST